MTGVETQNFMRLAQRYQSVDVVVDLADGTTRVVGTGKDFGHGEVLLKVKVKENGASGANKFVFAAIAQHYKKRSDTWITEYTFDTVKVKFPDDANSYFHTRWFAYDPKDGKKHRIVVVMKILHNKQVLASRTVTSKSC